MTRSDSTGVLVVSNPTDPIGVPDWSDRVELVSSFGGYDARPDESLAGVTDVEILSDSNLAAANGHLSTVSIFDIRGTFLRNVGNRGNGPGEYQHLASLDICDGGSSGIVDLFQDRLTLLADDLSHQRTLRLVDPSRSPASPAAVRCTMTGEVLVLARQPATVAGATSRLAVTAASIFGVSNSRACLGAVVEDLTSIAHRHDEMRRFNATGS